MYISIWLLKICLSIREKIHQKIMGIKKMNFFYVNQYLISYFIIINFYDIFIIINLKFECPNQCINICFNISSVFRNLFGYEKTNIIKKEHIFVYFSNYQQTDNLKIKFNSFESVKRKTKIIAKIIHSEKRNFLTYNKVIVKIKA